MSCADWLLERMQSGGDATALVWKDQRFSYSWLCGQARSFVERFSKEGIGPGTVVALEADYSPNAAAALLALIQHGCIVVPLTSESQPHRDEFYEVAEVQRVIRLGDDDQPVGSLFSRQVKHGLTQELIAAGKPGLIVFSSGSTGKNKASLHDFSALLEKFKTPRLKLVTLTFLLLDHLGGINTLLYALSNLGTVVTLPSRDADLVCSAIAKHKVELLPTSPTFLNLLIVSEAYHRHDLSSLKRITYGTEVMPETTLRRMRELFPSVELQQTYGLTEIGVLRSKSRGDGSLWMKIGGEGVQTEVRDRILWVKSPSAMLGYLNAPSPFDAAGWLNTQDEVEVDGEYIKVLGRKSDIIIVGGQKVYPAEVESVLLQLANVKDATVYGEPNALTGKTVCARVNLFNEEPLDAFKTRMREFCRARLAPFKVPARVLLTSAPQHGARFKKDRLTPDAR